MVDTAHITTAAQLLDAGDIGRCELISGQLHMMTPAGDEHCRVSMALLGRIWQWAQQGGRRGVVYGPDTGFLIEREPDTVLMPDVAFIRADRATPKHRGFVTVIPDLVVETNSPGDRADDVAAKVQIWLSAGVKVVSVVEPRTRSVQVYHPDGRSQLLNDQQMLEGGEVMPGFSVAVSQIFDEN